MSDPGIVGDKRQIEMIDVWPHGEDDTYYSLLATAGQGVCEKIEVYEEIESWDQLDQMSRSTVPWVRVWRGGEVIFRVRDSSCSIRYETASE